MRFLNDLRNPLNLNTRYQKQAFLDTEINIKNNKYTKIYRKKQIVKYSSTSTLNTLNL